MRKGSHLSEEHKAKLSKANMGKHPSPETRAKMSKSRSGERHYLYGKHLSPEVKAKISKTERGKIIPEDVRLKMSESHKGARNCNFGREFSEEHRAKISQARRGRRAPPETRAKMAASQSGRRHSPETRAKMSAWQIGRKLPPETVAKVVATNVRLGTRAGERNGRWRGGVSFGPYCPKFNFEFKERVREFFGRKCLICDKTEADNGRKLDVHHVAYDKMICCNDKKPLFAALCTSHNSIANNGRDGWEHMFTYIIEEVYKGKSFYSKEEMSALKCNKN